MEQREHLEHARSGRTRGAEAPLLHDIRRRFRCLHADQTTGPIHGFRLSPSVPVRVSLEYLNIKGLKLIVVMFRAPLTDETHIRTIADQVMDAFRFVD